MAPSADPNIIQKLQETLEANNFTFSNVDVRIVHVDIIKSGTSLAFLDIGECYSKALSKWYSQLKPNQAKLQIKSKLASASGQTILPSRASLQETIQLSEYDRGVA